MTPDDDDKRLAEIRERADAATPGPWHCAEETGHRGCYYVATELPYPKHAITGWGHVTQTQENAAFIAAAREDVPWLLAQLAEARGAGAGEEREAMSEDTSDGFAEVERLRGALERIAEYISP